MKPAELVIAKFGGVRPLARLLGLDHSTLCGWQRKAPKGSDGLVPSRYHKPLLDLAKEKGIELTPDDLIYGTVKT